MARIIRKRRDEDTRRQDRMTEILQTIANIDAGAVAQAAERARLATEAEGIFRDLGDAEFRVETEHGPYIATEVRSAGKAVNTIDPAKFRKLVEDDKAFFAAIKVTSDKAKELLSGKELADITTTTPAKAGDPVFVVSAASTKGKKK